MPRKTRPVALAVHRNTLEHRRKREMAKHASTLIGGSIRETDIRAYAFVGLTADGGAICWWDTGGVIPLFAFTDVMASMLRKNIAESGVDEEWKPGLSQGARNT